ncbi:MAG: tripartite tricarboxylate transporter substrate-binding protein [Alphaproteobacteria bacterium]|nr:tripartite tricarboxylate transporter substrate-binding protein [Alphaproteobacteria bacterium]
MSVTRRDLLTGAMAVIASPALGQDANWPQRPLRILIPTAPGGSPDIASRLLGDKIAGRIGQPFVVESNTIGGGVGGLQIVAKTPDGHTFAMLTGGFATQAATLKNLPYEPLKDFIFVTSVVRYPMVYAVAPDSPIKSFKDMVDRARAEPNKVSYGIVGAGNVYHLLGKWIDNAGGIEMNAVPYRGTANALQDVLGGRVDVLSDASTSAIPRIKSGQLRALAVSSAEPYPLLPGVPTMAATIPGIKVESWLGLAAPVGTPQPIIDRLNSEFRWALDLPEIKKWAEESGVVPAPSTPQEFRARVESDVRQWTEIVIRNNISVQ